MQRGKSSFGNHKHYVSGHGGTRSPKIVARQNAERSRREQEAAEEREVMRLRGLSHASASEAVKNRRSR